MADDRLDDAIDAVVRAVDRIERATRAASDAPLTRAPAPSAPAAPAEQSAAAEPPAAELPPAAPFTSNAPAPAPAPESAPAPAPRAPGVPDMSGNTGMFWLPRTDEPTGLTPAQPTVTHQPSAPFAVPDADPGASSDQPFGHHPAPFGQEPTQPFQVEPAGQPHGGAQPEQPYDVTASPPSGSPLQPPHPHGDPAADAGQGLAPRPADVPSQPAEVTSQPAASLRARLGERRPQNTAEFSALGAATVRPFAEHGSASPEIHELVGRIVGRMQSLDDQIAAAAALREEISELVARLAAAAVKPR